MSFGEHVEELRRRLLWGLGTVALIFLVAWLVFPTELQGLFLRPHFSAVDALARHDPPIPVERRLALHSPLEEVFYTLKVATLAAMILGLPVFLYHMWSFVAAGLYRHERRVVLSYLPWSLALAFVGMAFGYFVLIPLVLEYLYSRPEPALFLQAYRLDYYFSLFLLLTVALALVFQLPLIMLGLEGSGLVGLDAFRRYRRHFILIAFVLGAVVTPPDPVSQILMATPSILLYEVGVLLLRLRRLRSAS